MLMHNAHIILADATAGKTGAKPLPTHDWQFWVATLIALVALYVVASKFLPKRWLPMPGRRSGRKVSITIDGKPPERK